LERIEVVINIVGELLKLQAGRFSEVHLPIVAHQPLASFWFSRIKSHVIFDHQRQRRSVFVCELSRERD